MIRLAALAACLLVAVPPAQAGVFTHEESGLSLDVPAGWKAEVDGNHMLHITSDQGTDYLNIWVVPSDSLEAALGLMDTEVGKVLQDSKTTSAKPEEGTVGSVRSFSIEGTAKFEGHPVNWEANLLDAAAPAIVLYVHEPGSEGNKASFDTMIQSVKLVEAADEGDPEE